MKSYLKIFAAAVVLLLTSCGKDNAEKKKETDYDIYVVGSCLDWRNHLPPTACLWKNGVLEELAVPDETESSECVSIAVSGGSVYIAGHHQDKGCYWKDGEYVEVSDNGEGFTISHMAVENGTVYLGASTYYWDGDAIVPLQSPYFSARGIAVANGTVYLPGQDFRIGRAAACWTNGTVSLLDIPGGSNDSEGQCAVSSDGSVYIGGYFISKDGWQPCYWKDGACTLLDIPREVRFGRLCSICVENGTVYAAGRHFHNERYTLCYWVNKKYRELELPSDEDTFEAVWIAAADGKFCILCKYFDHSSEEDRACYWKDGGERIDIGEEIDWFDVSGVALVKK